MKVNKKLYTCPSCGGQGQYVEEYLDGYPRYEHCGFCKGTGKVDPHMLGITLGCLSVDARAKKKDRQRHLNDLADLKVIAEHMKKLDKTDKEQEFDFQDA